MAMQVQCPGCSSKFKLKEVPEKTKKMRCPKCKEIITVKPPGEEELEEAVAAAPTRSKKTSTKKKTSAKKSGAKKKARPAPVEDDWGDFDDDYGDEGYDDFGDDFDDDDFEEPAPTRRRKGGKSGGKATAAKGKAKGKSKGKKGKAEAKSGGKGKLILFVVLGLLVVGGGIGAFMMMGGDDDTASEDGGGESGSGDNNVVAAAGDLNTGNAGGGDQAANDNPLEDAAGQNVFDLKYIPANSDLLIRLKPSEIWNAPLLADLIAMVPPGAMDMSPVKPEDFESVTLGIEIDPQAIPQGGQQPSPEMLARLSSGYAAVGKLTRAMSAQDLGQFITGSEDHGGQQIHQLPGENGEPGDYLWFADSQTVVIGSKTTVQAAIDSKGRERRFQRFDFADKSSQLVIAFGPRNPSAMQSQQTPPTGQPMVDQLVQVLQQHSKGSGLGINVYNDVRIAVQVACNDSAGAAAVQTELSKALEEGKKQFGQLKNSPQGKFMGSVLGPIEAMLGRVQVTTSGDVASFVLDATEQEITQIRNNPIVAGMMNNAMGPAMAGGGGGPMSFGGGGPDDKPFVEVSKETIDFAEDIQPIIRWRCKACHVADQQGGLSLASYDSLMNHSGSKGKAVVSGDPEASSVYTMVSGGSPPHDLKETEAELIKAWIKAGAKPPGEVANVNVAPTAPTAPARRPPPPPAGNGGGFGGFGGNNSGFGGGTDAPSGPLSYAKDIEPMLKQRCGNCHIRQQKGQFSLTSLQSLTNHSGRKGKALAKGNAAQSSLYTLVQNGQMPPGRNTKLTRQQIDTIKQWIDGGANP